MEPYILPKNVNLHFVSCSDPVRRARYPGPAVRRPPVLPAGHLRVRPGRPHGPRQHG